jgi:hypothetical protein
MDLDLPLRARKAPMAWENSRSLQLTNQRQIFQKIVLDGYDFVINGITKITPAQLNETIKLFGKFEMTKSMRF